MTPVYRTTVNDASTQCIHLHVNCFLKNIHNHLIEDRSLRQSVHGNNQMEGPSTSHTRCLQKLGASGAFGVCSMHQKPGRRKLCFIYMGLIQRFPLFPSKRPRIPFSLAIFSAHIPNFLLSTRPCRLRLCIYPAYAPLFYIKLDRKSSCEGFP